MDDRLAKLRDGLANLGLDEGNDVLCIASVLALRLPEDRYPPSSMLPQHQKLHNFAMLRKAVQQIARQAPLVLIVEDVHWIDPTSAEFFGQLRIPHVLLVLTTRPESDPAWSSALDPETIELGRLSKEQSRELIANVTGGRALPRGLVEELLLKTDGVPLFIEEQTKAVIESEMIVERDGAYELTRPLRDMRIAETLQDSLRARLDRLDPESRGVAQLASTFGRSFTHEFLEAVASSMPPMLLHNALARLLEAGVLLRHGDAQHTTYYFRHALVQDVAYQSLLKSTRRGYHLACADALITWFPETEHAQPELIAQHCRAAGDTARAVKYYEVAGQVAAKHWALQEAIEHLRQALSLLQELPDDSKRRRRELGLLFALGPALMSTLGYANKVVEDTYSRIRQLCESEGLQAKMFPALVGLWQHNMVGGSLDRARALGAELLDIAKGVDDPTFRLIAMRSLGSTLFLLGDFQGALEYTSAGWRMYDIEEHGSLSVTHGNDQGVAHGVYLAWTLWTLGHPDAAHAQAQETIELANRLKHPMSIAFSRSYAATVANLRGEFALGASLASAAREVADQHGLALWSAHSRTQLGWARIGLGDVATGLACLEEGIRAWFQTGAGAGGSLMHAVVAETHLATGDLATADARLSQAEALIAKTGERFYEAEILRLRGEIALRATSDPSVGRTFLARGLEVARAQGARSWELRLSNSLATSLIAEGRDEAARTLLSRCLDGFDEGAGTSDRSTTERLIAGPA
jgi:predicted ATPase